MAASWIEHQSRDGSRGSVRTTSMPPRICYDRQLERTATPARLRVPSALPGTEEEQVARNCRNK